MKRPAEINPQDQLLIIRLHEAKLPILHGGKLNLLLFSECRGHKSKVFTTITRFQDLAHTPYLLKYIFCHISISHQVLSFKLKERVREKYAIREMCQAQESTIPTIITSFAKSLTSIRSQLMV